MKRIACFFIVLTVISGGLAGKGLGNTTLKIATGEWPPFLSKNLKYNGVGARIVTEAFALEGIQVEYGWFPWARAFEYVKCGKWEASAIWTESDNRAKFVEFSKPVIENKMVFFYLKSKPFEWSNMSNLNGLSIGGVLAYHYGKNFEDAEKSGLIRVDRITNEEANLKKLLSKRVDLAVIESEVGLSLLRTYFTPTERALVAYHPTPVNTFTNHLVVSKKRQDYKKIVAIFNRGLMRLKNSGKIEQYMEESRRKQD